jgi:hypothetical protein
VDGGPLPYPDAMSSKGVIVSNQTRLGIVSYDQCLDNDTGKWLKQDEKVQGVVLMRKNQHTMVVLEKVKALADEINGVQRVPRTWSQKIGDWFSGADRSAIKDYSLAAATNGTKVVTGLASTDQLREGMAVSGPGIPAGTAIIKVVDDHSVTLNKDAGPGKPTLTFTRRSRLLPGVELQCYYDREELVDRTTHTVRENLLVGIALVVVILLMFLSNVRTCVIVAINLPLALLFSFAVLYFRGKSANLLSIGAVDFGIICDSTVIIVENIYRNLATGQHADKPMKERILLAIREVDNALFFSTLIMVVAFLPLFTMQGAEGELFGPMAQTYACALGGALFFAMTLTPVLCMYLFKGMKPREDNFFVKFLKGRYLWQLRL